MVSASFFHSLTFFVFIYASGIVMFAAMHTFVEAPQTLRMSANRESFL